jgi:hypothetical protein
LPHIHTVLTTTGYDAFKYLQDLCIHAGHFQLINQRNSNTVKCTFNWGNSQQQEMLSYSVEMFMSYIYVLHGSIYWEFNEDVRVQSLAATLCNILQLLISFLECTLFWQFRNGLITTTTLQLPWQFYTKETTLLIFSENLAQYWYSVGIQNCSMSQVTRTSHGSFSCVFGAGSFLPSYIQEIKSKCFDLDLGG